MENIPRNVEKDLTEFTPPKSKKYQSKWEIIFINELGKSYHFRFFKTLITINTLIILTLVSVAIVFYVFYSFEIKKHINMNLRLLKAEKAYSDLKMEKEGLISKLLAAETQKPNSDELKSTGNDILAALEKPKQKKIVEAGNGIMKHDPPIQPTKKQPVSEIEKNLEVNSEPKSKIVEINAPDSEKMVKKPLEKDGKPVSIEDLIVAYEKISNEIKIKFKLKNNLTTGAISGYTFVAIQQDEHNETKWTTFPQVEFLSGVPNPADKGKFFKISNYKTVRFRVKVEDLSKNVFQTKIFVFSQEGTLYLQESFQTKVTVVDDESSKIS